MTKDDERQELIDAVGAAIPISAALAKMIELASNDDLRRMKLMAEAARDALETPEPQTLSPRYTSGERAQFARIHRSIWSLDGGYTLAKDECGSWYSGPGWVPFNLYSCVEFESESMVADCARTLMNGVGAEKLWADIEARYGRPSCAGSGLDARRNNHCDSIAASLPMACARAKAYWSSIPRLTPVKFQEWRDEQARRADQLATELERFYLPRDPAENEFDGLLDFQDLMSEDELDTFDKAVRLTALRISNRARKQVGALGRDWEDYNGVPSDARALGYTAEDVHSDARSDAIEIYGLMLKDHTSHGWPYGGVPTLPDMLKRIARKFREDGTRPPIKSPNLGTAERSFFARELCKYFWRSYGSVSPAIVRDITAMFYEGGIAEGNVSQIIAKVKAEHPLPNP